MFLLATEFSKDGGVDVDFVRVDGAEGMTASDRRTGVDMARREEIHECLIEWFTEYHKNNTDVRRVNSMFCTLVPSLNVE